MESAHALAMSRSSASGSVANSMSASQVTSVYGGGGSSLLSPSMGAANGLVAVLRLLKLVDTASGLCLFTSHWKWHPHAHAEGVDALVQSLAQFAREIDGGGEFTCCVDVMRVQFDSHVSRSASNSIGNGSANATTNGSATATSSESATPTPPKSNEDERRPSSVGDIVLNGSSALEMLSHTSGPIQAVLFHDRVSEVTTQRLRLFVEQVVDRFLHLYQSEIARLTPSTAAHHAALSAEQTAELVAPFASFEDVFQIELLTTL